MKKNDTLYLVHMVEQARKIQARVANLTRDQFDQSETHQLVLVHQVQIIGEAASRVSPETRETIPAIPWRQIVGMRNRIVHDYLEINYDVVWSVAIQSVPELLSVLEPLVGDIIAQRKKTDPTSN
jgi:uncharacterized protein with HEPN domain